MPSKAELLDTVQAENRAWQELLAAVGEDRLGWPGAAGPDWSVKDAIAHITAWRGRTIARLDAALHGTTPPPPPWPADLDEDAPGAVDRVNAWFYEQARGKTPATVLAESEASWQELARLVAALPEADLRTPGRFPWLDGEPLWMVLYWSFEHVHEHIYHLAVQAWRALPQ